MKLISKLNEGLHQQTEVLRIRRKKENLQIQEKSSENTVRKYMKKRRQKGLRKIEKYGLVRWAVYR